MGGWVSKQAGWIFGVRHCVLSVFHIVILKICNEKTLIKHIVIFLPKEAK